MTETYVLQCDLGHRWEVRTDGGRPESTACPEGHEAVSVRHAVPADRTTVSLVPAAWIADAVTGATADDSQFFLEIANAGRSEQRRSSKRMSWEEAVKHAELFRSVGWADAVNRWHRSGL